jgi:hypothetical protein
LPIAEEELGRAGYLHYRTDSTGPYPRKVPIADESADPQAFSAEERAIIDRSLEELAPHGGRGASRWSHEQSAGWQTVQLDKEIPYASAFVSTEPLNEKETERALQRSREEGWAAIRP